MGVDRGHVYEDSTAGRRDDRPGLAACLKALRERDTLIVWKLDRLGRDLRHLVNTVYEPTTRGIGLKVLTGQGAAIDTTTAAGQLLMGIFAALAEFQRELIVEQTKAGMAAARARGQSGGRPFQMTPAKLRLAMAAMGQRETTIGVLCTELGVSRQTLYRHVDPKGSCDRTVKDSWPPANPHDRCRSRQRIAPLDDTQCNPLLTRCRSLLTQSATDF